MTSPQVFSKKASDLKVTFCILCKKTLIYNNEKYCLNCLKTLKDKQGKIQKPCLNCKTTTIDVGVYNYNQQYCSYCQELILQEENWQEKLSQQQKYN
ncbi:MAG: hypothetical protein FWG55_02175 [Candidatus Bathyarchaeota archaeon]|nr:hypothetical protein [Candidatus Termiticorpusculum sp.]